MLFHRSLSLSTCRCGHASEAHQHYRRGTDCAACECRRFRMTVTLVRRQRDGESRRAPGESRAATA
ncbi:hypothetical protein [Nocardioides sp. SYSU D00038]|uniref:hypothetical protein n=1 Tax=Nocardioides sp. SYSU D00038 TaxID=2812554 RepID=UPI001966EE43|nr:hypothetical protein [Nocardioides sp. SYSU D00038]